MNTTSVMKRPQILSKNREETLGGTDICTGDTEEALRDPEGCTEEAVSFPDVVTNGTIPQGQQ